MKICFICSEYPPGKYGGIGILIQTLARTLVKRGHAVRVVGIYPFDYQALDYEEDQGVQVWRMRETGIPKIGWLLDRWRLYRVVAKWAENVEIDLVEVPDYQGWVAGWPALPLPVVVRYHGSASHNARELNRSLKSLYNWIERTSCRRADFHCFVSKYLAEKTRELFDLNHLDDIQVIYNPVVNRVYHPFSVRKLGMVVFAGTLNKNKGVIQLISAWSSVKKVCPHAELHLYGKDWFMDNEQSMWEYLLSHFQSVLRQNVFYHGFVPREELLHALETANVAVYPSFVEGFAMAPLEAMSVGCPVIYTNRASGPELIEHGKNGFLVDPENPEDIANAVIQVLQNSSLAEQIGRSGWEKIMAEFATDTIIPQNESFYTECIGRFKRGENHKARKPGSTVQHG